MVLERTFFMAIKQNADSLPVIPVKSILSRAKDHSWFGTGYNMNLYRGCCHGCIYCDSRSDCYQIDHFDTVRAKENALLLLRDELRRKIYKGIIGTGSMSDPYNPFEKTALLTRHALELINAYDFGVAIATKSALITRDSDVLQEIAEHSPVICKMTITTASDALAAKLEPHVSSSSQRFDAIARLAEKGLFTGILLMPVIPFLEDSDENILAILRRAADCGARFVYPAFGMTTRPGQREYFLERLEKSFPGENLSARFMKRYAGQYHCASPQVKHLWNLFTETCNQLGLAFQMKDIIRLSQLGYGSPEQLSFFEK